MQSWEGMSFVSESDVFFSENPPLRDLSVIPDNKILILLQSAP